MTTLRLERLRRRLSAPVCGQSLAVFRIAFGLLMLHDTVYVLRAGWLTRYYVERDLLFPYFAVQVPAVPEPWLHGLWAACTACCVLVALGALYRFAIWVFNAVFTYFFLLDQVTYLNHFYMIILFGVLLGFTDAHRCWSLDRRPGRVAGSRKVPAWNVVVLGFQIEAILVFAGLVKIEVDWLRGEPLRQWMLERTWSPFSALFEIHWVTPGRPGAGDCSARGGGAPAAVVEDPDFVKFLGAHHARLGHGEVRIHADIWKSVNGRPFQRFVDPKVDLVSVEGMRWLGDEPWLLRPEPSQAAEGLVPDWYPPITVARLGAMLDALRDRQPRRATEAGAGGARAKLLTREAGER